MNNSKFHMETTSIKSLDTAELEQKVKAMYREVALHPEGSYHFEMGRTLAEKLGYHGSDLDRIPQAAIDSFAGVGYYFDLAGIREGETVLDLGSGSGMDSFLAALQAGDSGKVFGVDMTDEQLEKSESLRSKYGFGQVSFHKSYIEELPFPDASIDVVISNGVINLCADKEKVFREVARVLKPGGRLALADIVTEKQLPENIVCNTNLWASCIGGASQADEYTINIEKAGLKVQEIRTNENYSFISKSAKGASLDYGVKSISLVAVKL